jgi:hypothetical protein
MTPQELLCRYAMWMLDKRELGSVLDAASQVDKLVRALIDAESTLKKQGMEFEGNYKMRREALAPFEEKK